MTGSREPRRVLIFVYDIFGPSSQALQGADRISQHVSDIMVILPDFFKGKHLTENTLSTARDFLQSTGAFDVNVEVLFREVIPQVQERFPSIEKQRIGCFGLCWGGKLAVLASAASLSEDAPLGPTGQAHPGGLDADDAKKLVAPHICLASKDENKDVVDRYKMILARSSGSIVDTFDTMFHGWMGARANLNNDENRIEYERGYSRVAEFFSSHLYMMKA